MEKFRDTNFDLSQLTLWAAEIIKAFGTKKDREHREFDGLDSELLSYVGLGCIPLIHPQGDRTERRESLRYLGHCRKRPATQNLDTMPPQTSNTVEELELPKLDTVSALIESQSTILSQINIADSETPRAKGEKSNGEPRNQQLLRRTWSWKREARSRGGRHTQRNYRDEGNHPALDQNLTITWIFNRPEWRAYSSPPCKYEFDGMELQMYL